MCINFRVHLCTYVCVCVCVCVCTMAASVCVCKGLVCRCICIQICIVIYVCLWACVCALCVHTVLYIICICVLCTSLCTVYLFNIIQIINLICMHYGCKHAYYVFAWHCVLCYRATPIFVYKSMHIQTHPQNTYTRTHPPTPTPTHWGPPHSNNSLTTEEASHTVWTPFTGMPSAKCGTIYEDTPQCHPTPQGLCGQWLAELRLLLSLCSPTGKHILWRLSPSWERSMR